ncbi:ABC transporter ATP-binding protein [Aquabacter sp. CN5-332]|uniref:ABC transporter ATP-binding protein n=1 Tax=Aquabacter sp. CN5-332 TaxID=3156608 RepID=UPI0032B44591
MLHIDGVLKRFGGNNGMEIDAIARTDLHIQRGEFVTIVGPSGCGKSTLLNLISGLSPPSEGSIWVDGREVIGINRQIGYITQRDNLFPWRTLRDNVAFPLELAGVPAAARRREADKWIARVGLAGFEDAFPHQLSGGMRQRGNIIRTLIYEPEIILMDEPFGPLDAQTRLSLQSLLLSIWETQRSTVLFVTHDLAEAIGLADRVILMSARPGRIARNDPVEIPRPRDIFFLHDQPEFRRLYDLIWNELAVQMNGTH